MNNPFSGVSEQVPKGVGMGVGMEFISWICSGGGGTVQRGHCWPA